MELTLFALSQRAVGIGVDEGKVSVAMQQRDPKGAVIELILAQDATTRPHFGQSHSVVAPTPVNEKPEVRAVSAKHVMLSYQVSHN